MSKIEDALALMVTWLKDESTAGNIAPPLRNILRWPEPNSAFPRCVVSCYDEKLGLDDCQDMTADIRIAFQITEARSQNIATEKINMAHEIRRAINRHNLRFGDVHLELANIEYNVWIEPGGTVPVHQATLKYVGKYKEVLN